MAKILFVCLGNICRSPTAHGVFLSMVERAGLTDRIEVESAGTAAYHVGSPPDQRSTAAAANRGYDLSAIRAQQVSDTDFEYYDYLLAMDEENLTGLEQRCPSQYRHKLKLFLDYGGTADHEVPDPYYGGSRGFETVLDLVEDAAEGLLKQVRQEL
ncbi:low molecular weight phosphotyrosine protein phosphatase [Aestuariirhabdus sp. Z084]|uniref:low molecular weight protein-tyrosine-phosphatase n=1 Tax=Aestuariirhabdus haliotis TaxID=2918751 RepID=UPI00201B38E0|nr:low molecular weight protein-tyrosine-phosphatase [Aestuariirhabdus haliotis]MCL6414785.1 low molecular weight phosphotyrosine protein phosphatase [Aestuariirhabdus haliotis]MCL6418717.1 low molecular weight phosphotyrosine protein phosphatase [Aestuariirhabdus haliotis]